MLNILPDDDIAALINEAKTIPNGLRPYPNLVERNQHRRREYEITCTSGNTFVIAVRQSVLNLLDFSVILGFKMPGFNTIFRLRRYNGKSHYHTNTIENERFRDFHIHIATERYQRLGAKEDHFATVDHRFFVSVRSGPR